MPLACNCVHCELPLQLFVKELVVGCPVFAYKLELPQACNEECDQELVAPIMLCQVTRCECNVME